MAIDEFVRFGCGFGGAALFVGTFASWYQAAKYCESEKYLDLRWKYPVGALLLLLGMGILGAFLGQELFGGGGAINGVYRITGAVTAQFSCVALFWLFGGVGSICSKTGREWFGSKLKKAFKVREIEGTRPLAYGMRSQPLTTTVVGNTEYTHCVGCPAGYNDFRGDAGCLRHKRRNHTGCQPVQQQPQTPTWNHMNTCPAKHSGNEEVCQRFQGVPGCEAPRRRRLFAPQFAKLLREHAEELGLAHTA